MTDKSIALEELRAFVKTADIAEIKKLFAELAVTRPEFAQAILDQAKELK